MKLRIFTFKRLRSSRTVPFSSPRLLAERASPTLLPLFHVTPMMTSLVEQGGLFFCVPWGPGHLATPDFNRFAFQAVCGGLCVLLSSWMMVSVSVGNQNKDHPLKHGSLW